MATYLHCVRKYKSGPKRGKCKKYAPGPGRKKARGRKKFTTSMKGKVCIAWRGRKPRTCKKYGTRAEAARLGV